MQTVKVVYFVKEIKEVKEHQLELKKVQVVGINVWMKESNKIKNKVLYALKTLILY